MSKQTNLFNLMDGLTDESAQTKAEHGKKTKKNASAKTAQTSGSLTKDALENIYKSLISRLKKYFEENGFQRCVLGLSGGVDSSLTLKLAVDALGKDNVVVLMMPELGVTSHENMEHAKTLCEYFEVTYYYQSINNFLLDYKTLNWKPSKTALMNTKARIRSVMLYNYANSENALVLGTSNKSELLLGYGTKYGDLAADIEVIGDLYKTEVIKLADYLGLPPEIVNKIPTAELDLDQTDESELGATYQDIDKVLMRRDLGEQGCIEHGLPLTVVQMVFRRMSQNEHKTRQPYVIKIHD